MFFGSIKIGRDYILPSKCIPETIDVVTLLIIDVVVCVVSIVVIVVVAYTGLIPTQLRTS